jgi:hypothetical protein
MLAWWAMPAMSSGAVQDGGMPEDEMQQMLDVSLLGYSYCCAMARCSVWDQHTGMPLLGG